MSAMRISRLRTGTSATLHCSAKLKMQSEKWQFKI
jgi:hypothetical protein